MKITWKTEISELINAEKTAGLVKTVKESLEKWCSPRIDALELEMTVGGLSKQGLVFDGNSPLYNEAKRISKIYEKKLTDYDNFYKKVLEKSNEQRKKELLKLQTEISDKIDELKITKQSYLSAAEYSEEHPNNRYDQANVDFRSLADNQQEKIDELTKKLEQVNAELGKV